MIISRPIRTIENITSTHCCFVAHFSRSFTHIEIMMDRQMQIRVVAKVALPNELIMPKSWMNVAIVVSNPSKITVKLKCNIQVCKLIEIFNKFITLSQIPIKTIR